MARMMTGRIRHWGAIAALCLVFAQSLAVFAPEVAYAQATTPAPAAQTQTPQQPPAQQPPTQTDPCAAAGWTDVGTNLMCSMRSFYTSLLAVPVTMSVWLLTLVGVLFDFLLQHVIIGFGTSIYNLIQSPLETVWSTFRDLANILIVGMFVFIAISIILEVQEFGRKRLVVDVIIIAVLINFSLLFTKLAIDASNFIAYQFYTATIATTGNGSAQQNQQTIAGRLTEYMGVSSYADTAGALEKVAASPDAAIGTTVVHTVGASLLLLGAAGILLYGSVLLSIRAVVIILLLLFSSLAFASYLVPGKSRQMFNAWLSELISVVVFAPVLMLMLWATLQIAHSLKVAPGSGTLGSLITNPTANQGGFVAALFSYLIIGGLLYATFAIANILSHKAKGMSMVSGTLQASAWRFGMAPMLRQTVGRGAAWVQGRFEKSAGTRMGEAARVRSGAMGDIMGGKDPKQIEAQRKAAAAKLEGKAVGNQLMADRVGRLAGYKFGTDKSFSSIITDRTKAAEAAAKKIKVSDEDRNAIRDEAMKGAQEQRKAQGEILQATKDSTEKMMQEAQTNAENVSKRNEATASLTTAKERQHDAEVEQKKSEDQHQSTLKDLREKAVQKQRENNAAGKEAADREIKEHEAARETERKAQNEKIQEARARVVELQKKVDEHQSRITRDGTTEELKEAVQKATDAYTDAAKKLKEHKPLGEKEAKATAEKAADAIVGATTQGIAKAMGRRHDMLADRLWAGMTGADAKVEAAMVKKFKYKPKTDWDKLRESLKTEMRDDAEGGGEKGGKTDKK